MNAFISRSLSPDSEFSRLLRTGGWQVHGQALVTLEPLPFEAVPGCDWIFFASKNAVQFFFRQVTEKQIPLPETKWAALGEATAEALAMHVSAIDFTGNGEPEATAKAFRQQAAMPETVHILFPAARNSMQSVAGFLSGNFQAIHLEVYDNQPIPNPSLRSDDVLVFTSPMNAGAYFAHHLLLPGQKVVAIGATTAEALKRLGVPDVTVATEPTERSLAEAVIHVFG
jgi:uroporphyrinogen-III synthase